MLASVKNFIFLGPCISPGKRFENKAIELNPLQLFGHLFANCFNKIWLYICEWNEAVKQFVLKKGSFSVLNPLIVHSEQSLYKNVEKL